MPEKRGNSEIRWNSREIEPPANLAALRYEIGAVRTGAILESVARSGEMGRYSIFAAEPVRVVSADAVGGTDPFEQLSHFCRPWSRLATPCALPFVGGWIGYFGYEAGRTIEPTAGWRDQKGRLPVSTWALYDTVLIYDAMTNRWQVAGVELPAESAGADRPPLDDRLDELADCIAYLDADYMPHNLSESLRIGPSHWNDSRDAYLSKVRRVVDYIGAGDIFQVNLARRLRLAVEDHPFTIYERLCEANPATHAAYLSLHGTKSQLGPAAIISSSPELFLSVRDGVVTTRPIKGTRPRGAEAAEDRAARSALAGSEKDRAELNMIIDLERNDLGRVCEFGSVRVESDGEIEALPTVFHRTATIRGRLREGADVFDLLRATFPGGSITGAPKVRAMQIIHELEPDERGAYCGAIGYIGIDGCMQLNLPIRTMSYAGGEVDLHVGSGIVADSTPEDEYRELQAKAAGMLRALGLHPPDRAEAACINESSVS